MDRAAYDNYIAILASELIPAMGCTEPIAVALAGARAAYVLGGVPDHMDVYCSGNIVKNVKGVVVPNSGGQMGIAAAAVLGAVGGDYTLGLEVIEGAGPAAIEETRRLVAEGMCDCHLAENEGSLYIRVEAARGADVARVTIRTRHNQFDHISLNGQVLLEQGELAAAAAPVDKERLNVRDIIEFADQLDPDDVRGLLDRQIEYNAAISEEGLKNAWGAQVGRTLLSAGENFASRAAAKAAAGSDARMGGSSMPVVINSGSGNQGIAVTIPLYEYAMERKVPRDRLYRALALANLISIHEKRFIGNLSAYCGAVSAATASAAGIAYLDGASYEVIGNTIINSIGTIGGMVCDGAKSSCASKVASAVSTALMGYDMAKEGRALKEGEGLVEGGVEGTIRNIGRLGCEGMRATDVEILNIMLGKH
ncbi:serine dehydratase subunit alpha family protein [Bacillota bacterium Meth-B3]|nr:L-serine ammonia-lyase, iron-sulfur-dependent, subunit alpha [Christensenellaceae bacterium]